MPKPPAPPLPEAVTSGQIGRLLQLSERAINARRLDGRLPVRDGGVDLAAVVRAGIAAGRGREKREQTDWEAHSLAQWAATCAAAAALSPRPGETPEAAAARGLRAALDGDDYFMPPAGWEWPATLDFAEGGPSLSGERPLACGTPIPGDIGPHIGPCPPHAS